jgi:hypothetical protein
MLDEWSAKAITSHSSARAQPGGEHASEQPPQEQGDVTERPIGQPAVSGGELEGSHIIGSSAAATILRILVDELEDDSPRPGSTELRAAGGACPPSHEPTIFTKSPLSASASSPVIEKSGEHLSSASQTPIPAALLARPRAPGPNAPRNPAHSAWADPPTPRKPGARQDDQEKTGVCRVLLLFFFVIIF